MTEQEDNQDVDELKRVNAELASSLDRCRALLRDCRTKLAANTDDQVTTEQSRRRG